MKNVKELIKNEIVINDDFENEMLQILLDNIDEMNLKEVKNYMFNGAIGSLIYPYEIDGIFSKYYDDIFDLLNEYIYENGQICFELNANNLVWFAYEKLVYIWSCEINWDELESELDEE